jgi:hypothetical protein
MKEAVLDLPRYDPRAWKDNPIMRTPSVGGIPERHHSEPLGSIVPQKLTIAQLVMDLRDFYVMRTTTPCS